MQNTATNFKEIKSKAEKWQCLLACTHTNTYLLYLQSKITVKNVDYWPSYKKNVKIKLLIFLFYEFSLSLLSGCWIR